MFNFALKRAHYATDMTNSTSALHPAQKSKNIQRRASEHKQTFHTNFFNQKNPTSDPLARDPYAEREDARVNAPKQTTTKHNDENIRSLKRNPSNPANRTT
jgi:hypothetical protein